MTVGTVRTSRIDRWAEWYRLRTGRRYVTVMYALITVWTLALLVPAYSFTGAVALGVTPKEGVQLLVLFEVGYSVPAAATFFIAMRDARALRRWSAGEKSEAVARAAVRWILEGMPRTLLKSGVLYALTTLPLLVIGSRLVGLSVAGFLGWFVACMFALFGALAFLFLVLELAMSGVVREIGEGWNIGSEVRGLSLREKVLIAVPLIFGFGAMVGGATRVPALGRDASLAVWATAAVLVSVTVGVAMAGLLRRSLLDRLEGLRDALGRVAHGDYGQRLAAANGDELDDVVRGFNQMTSRLSAHDEEMRASRARIVTAADESRRRVERDLHDGAQQYLVLMQLELGQLAKKIAGNPDVEAQARRLQSHLGQALTELRDLAHGLYPAVLEADGLSAALAAAGERSPLTVHVSPDGVGRLPSDLEAAVYFCCLEAMQNAAKHAGQGASVAVSLEQEESGLRFSVVDDGRGYDSTSTAPSGGLQNMADRIGALGGQLTIESQPGRGTTVSGTVPLDAP